MSTSGGYRPQIDGIRALAVLSVMWFHAGLPGIPGGFLGVDIFFVISGYLITGIIARAAALGSFSLTDFYMRRLRRIVPALLVASALTLPFAWWLMLPDDLENYGQSLVASVASANNVLLYLTTGYFELEAAYKPLVHTWSLGVEEQYYLIIPLLLALTIRLRGQAAAFALLAVLSASSLALAEWLRAANPDANFYLLPSRFWELGLGGLAALAEPQLRARFPATGWHHALAALGLAAMLASLFVLDEAANLPGWQGLLPTLGTALVLIFADSGGVGRALGLAPLRWIGLISYSAYLYHQPVFAFIRISSLEEPSPLLMLAAVPVILLLAWLSWRFVEQPWRDKNRTSSRKVLAFTVGGSAVLALAGLALYATSGLRARWPELADGDPLFGARQNAAYVERPFALENRPFASQDRTRNVLVIGNSFARDFINMGLETGAFARHSLSYSTNDSCLGEWPRAFTERASQAGAAVLGSGGPPDCAMIVVGRLRALGVARIIVLGPKNFGFNNNAVMLLPPEQRYAFRTRPLRGVVEGNAWSRRHIPPSLYVDLLALLDDGTGTVPVFTPERKFISQDRQHLTQAGALHLGQLVFAQPQFAFLSQATAPSADRAAPAPTAASPLPPIGHSQTE